MTETPLEITADSNVEELLDEYPWANGVMIRLGLPCVRCGEPFWGTVGELAQMDGFNVADVLAALNEEKERRGE